MGGQNHVPCRCICAICASVISNPCSIESHPPSSARCSPIPLYAWHATFFCHPCVSSTIAFNSSTVSVGCEYRFPCLSTHDLCVMCTLIQPAPCPTCRRAAFRASTGPSTSCAPL